MQLSRAAGLGVLLILWSPLALRAQTFTKHVVVAQEGNAADVGRDVLRQGGTATDAAVATAFALAVTHPAAGNLGGGGFLVAYDAARRAVVTIDFREAAPKGATERMYLRPDGTLLPRHRAGAWAAGVPGTVRGLALAHARLGKRPWPTLVQPAARLAREGFPVSAELARSLNGQLFDPAPAAGSAAARKDDLSGRSDRLADFPESVAAFRKSDGSRWKEGDRLIQPDLAETLDRIAEHGPDEFYKGRTAELIARYMAGHEGLVTLDDLAAYQAKERAPVHTSFRGYEVYGMGPPSSGGIVVVQMLNILERYDLKADGPFAALTLHRVTEAMRRAFFTRATAVADPDVVDVPVAKLTSKAYADELARSITDRATPSAQLAPFPVLGAEGEHTTHLSTLDGDGNAVALTYTLEEGYGAKAVVAGAGFLLNNEMGDFNLIPGRTDTSGRIGTPANLIAPGKRILSSQAPTLVLRDGRVRLVTGSPGGRTIPNTVLWVVLNVLEFGRSPREAVDAPRTHHPWFPDVLTVEGSTWPPEALEALKAMGHRVRRGGVQGDAHSIVVDAASGTIHGVADRRRATAKASGD
ncbi:MAG: gamma-glutamyltransferase family protein [Isosphaeraceae bacterium]|nr:gamma-glutamyltransferase family protein [Isosphaeraceae bacterium]